MIREMGSFFKDEMATDLCSFVVRSVIFFFLYVDRGCVESLKQWKLAKMNIESSRS